MGNWANPWGYTARNPYLEGAAANPQEGFGEPGEENDNPTGPGGPAPPDGRTPRDPTRPFDDLNDVQRLYYRDNPDEATRAYFDAMTGGNRSSPFAKWLNTRAGEMMQKFQRYALYAEGDPQYVDYLNEGQGENAVAGGPMREQFAQEWRQLASSQRGEQPWSVRRGGW